MAATSATTAAAPARPAAAVDGTLVVAVAAIGAAVALVGREGSDGRAHGGRTGSPDLGQSLAAADESYRAGRMDEAEARRFVAAWNRTHTDTRALLEDGEIRTRPRAQGGRYPIPGRAAGGDVGDLTARGLALLGTVDDLREASFVLPDGRMLGWPGHVGERLATVRATSHHPDIAQALTGSNAVDALLRQTGWLRVQNFRTVLAVQVGRRITAAQARTLRQAAGEFENMDIDAVTTTRDVYCSTAPATDVGINRCVRQVNEAITESAASLARFGAKYPDNPDFQRAAGGATKTHTMRLAVQTMRASGNQRRYVSCTCGWWDPRWYRTEEVATESWDRHRATTTRAQGGAAVCGRCGYAARRAGEVSRGLCPACARTGSLVDVESVRPDLVLELQEANLPRPAAGRQMAMFAPGGYVRPTPGSRAWFGTQPRAANGRFACDPYWPRKHTSSCGCSGGRAKPCPISVKLRPARRAGIASFRPRPLTPEYRSELQGELAGNLSEQAALREALDYTRAKIVEAGSLRHRIDRHSALGIKRTHGKANTAYDRFGEDSELGYRELLDERERIQAHGRHLRNEAAALRQRLGMRERAA